jgi:hypothetical protein
MWMPRFMDQLSVTLRNGALLRAFGFRVGKSGADDFYTVRPRCRISVMRIPPGARALATGQPVEAVTLSLRSWSRLLLWRLTLRV